MDVIVFGRTTEEYDKRLKPTPKQIEVGAILNQDCLFRQSQFKFLRHIVDNDGISEALGK